MSLSVAMKIKMNEKESGLDAGVRKFENGQNIPER
jgi:hypothetical protein